MQRGSEGWEKGGKAGGQDANMTNQPAGGTPFEQQTATRKSLILHSVSLSFSSGLVF